MGQLTDRIALVTGGAKGLGRFYSLALAEAGADVAIFDLGDGHRDAEPGYPLGTQADLDEAVSLIEAQGRRAVGLTGDVRNQNDLELAIDTAVRDFGKIDIVVANAGIAMMGPAWEMSREEWDLLVGTNLTGVWQTCKAVIPHMIEQQYGRIILISSCVALKGWEQLAPYAATKRAVIALAETLAMELAPHNITVNALAPSTVDSGTNRGLALKHGLVWDDLVGGWLDTQTIKHLVEPQDLSRAVIYLASDDARFITGITLPVDAGSSIL
jgi:NAD(P)-dependent dehydrogenase (short-subunit alcohol dehydrogenase family)